MTTQKIEFENSNGNVFADLGLDDAEELYTRSALGAQVVTILKEEGYTQAETSRLLGIKQPEWSALTNMDDVDHFIEKVGFPVLVRPSYVLSGAAMNICSNEDELKRFLKLAANVSEDHPVVISRAVRCFAKMVFAAVGLPGCACNLVPLDEDHHAAAPGLAGIFMDSAGDADSKRAFVS